MRSLLPLSLLPLSLLPLSLLLPLVASSTSSWSQVSLTHDDNEEHSPPPTMSAITGAFANGTQFLLFGGCTSSCCFAPVDAQWELNLSPDLTQGTWTQRHPSSSSSIIPSARFGAASTVDSTTDTLYAFGGQDSSQAFLGDLWQYEASTQEWSELKPSFLFPSVFQRPPSPRAAASLSVVGGGGGGGGRGREKHLVLIGGFGRQGAKEDEVWGLKLSSTDGGGKRLENMWMRLTPTSAVKEEEEGEEEGTPSRSSTTSGGLPARWHHVAVPVNAPATTNPPSFSSFSSSSSSSSEKGRGQKDGVVIVGGSDDKGQDHNEALLIEIDWKEGTYIWRALATEVEKETSRPPVRHGHLALHPPSPLPSSFFHIFGGLNTTSDTLPSSFLSDTFRFDLPPVEAWTEEETSAPGPRAYAGVGHGERHMVVMGGFAGYTGDTDDRLLSDVWVFRHEAGEVVERREGGEGGSGGDGGESASVVAIDK